MPFVPGLLIAASTAWLVLPVYGEHPPPSDPTLLRLSQQVAQDFTKNIKGSVRLVSRDIRADVCRQNGNECPVDTASMLKAARVLELVLADDLSHLAVAIYGPNERLLQAKLECVSDEGKLSCDTKPFKALLQELESPEYSEVRMAQHLDTLRPRLNRCFPRRKVLTDVRLRFLAHPSGEIHSVNVTPRKVGRSEAGRCAARILESHRLPGFRGGPQKVEMGLIDTALEMRKD